MGFSLSSLNPGNLLTEGFNSITGVNDARRAANAANAANQAAITRALEALRSGTQGATDTLQEGFGLQQNLVSGGGAFDVNEFGQGLTMQGFGQSLSDIASPTGAFGALIDERQQAATNALGAAGLTRSGVAAETAAQIPLETALQLENLMFGRQSGVANQLASLQGGLTSNLANLQIGEASNIANLETQSGKSEAETALAVGQAQANALAPFLEAGAGAVASSGGIGALLGFLSDERLKTNIQEIGRDGALTFYSWDWIPEIKELNLPLMNVGLIAQDVQRIAPEYVHPVGNFLAIDYDGILGDDRWQ